MKNLNKNILRYLGKNKFITLSLSIFVFLVSMIFSMFQGITTSMQNSYTTLVDDYNLHNVVIYDNFNQNEQTSDIKKSQFYEELNKLGIYYRQFESINVYSSNSKTTSKIIKYNNDYAVDQLDIFSQKGLPINKDNGHYILPSGWNLNDVLKKASSNLNSADAQQENIFARQLLVYFAANSTLKSDSKFGPQFKYVLDYIYQNPDFDPLNPSPQELKTSQIKSVKSYIKMFVDPTDPDYAPPPIRGSKITFMMQNKTTLGTPLNGYYEDPTSVLAIVNPNWLDANNKEVLNFDQYISEYAQISIDEAKNYIYNNNPTSISQLPKSTPNSMDSWINSLDDKYKVYVNSIPYVIVGTGITPDMMFPIISYDNLVPNPETESIVYTNHSGYEKANFSFQSMYHESFIVAKYTGSETRADITSKLNSYVEKYMAWPANVEAVFWFDDSNNTMSPATLRVTFITQLLNVIVGVTYAISIFIAILLIIVLNLFVKMFITNNKNTIAILISNGVNKWNIVANMSMIGLLISIISIPIGYFVGAALQSTIYTVFSTYWMIPVSFSIFNPAFFFPLLIIPTGIFIGIIIVFAWFLLRKNVVSLLKEDQNVSLSKSSRYFKSIFNWAPIMIKFRSSLAFNSLAKIFFLTLSSITLSVGFTFISSSFNKIQNAYQYELNTNSSAYQINLVTPTIQSGQYYGVEIQDIGRSLKNQNGEIVAGKDYSSGFYSSAWKNSPLFKTYSLMHWSSASDSSAYTSEITYLKNFTEIFPILDVTFGISGASTNPMDIVKSIAPNNQIYGLYQSMLDLATREMSDMRPFNQAFAFKFNANGSINKTGYITANDTNSYDFPSTWAIQNFNESNPVNWILNYNNREDVGVISAPEIPGLQNIDDVLNYSGKQLADLLNAAYSTYDKKTDTTNIPEFNTSIKYYPNLFSTDVILPDNTTLPSVISNIRKDPNNENIVLFDVDVANNTTKRLLTNRSLFTRNFYKTPDNIDSLTPDEIKSNVNVARFFPDPFNNDVYYELDSKKALAPLPTNFTVNYVNYVLLNYLDPVFIDTYYRIQYNQIIFNKNTDEPFVNIDARIQTSGLRNDLLNITGIQKNSKFIKLYNNGKLINDDLFNSKYENPLIINNFAAKKYNLKIGDKLTIYPENNVYRKTITNGVEFLSNPSIELNYDNSKVQPITFTVVNINNTGNGVQMYTNIEIAQKSLGLATAKDYLDPNNISTFPNATNNYKIEINMNNEYNDFGGFNGIFTSNQQNILLTKNLSLYSLSGMYTASDAWEDSALMNTLIKHTLNTDDQLPYLANAFNMSSTELKNLWTQTPVNEQANFINNVRNLYCSIYGKSSLNSTFETASSVEMTKIMFEQMSKLYDQVSTIVVTLIILLCLLVVILCSIMIINDMIKLIAILKTLGYADNNNAVNIIIGFVPSWILTTALSIPLSIVAVNMFQQFVFTNLSIFIGISVNWPMFVIIQLLVAMIFAIIYGYSIYYFKKKNILSTIRW